jgi:hypothetical protein
MVNFVLSLAALICTLVLGVFRAAVVATLWGWFVVAQFGVAPLSLAAAYGLCLTGAIVFPGHVSTLGHIYSKVTENENTDEKVGRMWGSVFVGFFYPTFGLILGYVAKAFL